MEEKNENIVMSRIAFERMQAKDERNDLWRNIIIVVLILLLVATNAMWLYYWNLYDYVDDYSVEVDSEGDGNANYLNGEGDINNGQSESDSEEEQDT
jgi:hypothetical protein